MSRIEIDQKTQTLSDGSLVYSVEIHDTGISIAIHCLDRQTATMLAAILSKMDTQGDIVDIEIISF